MEFQNLNLAKPKIRHRLDKNPNTRLSTLFRYLRGLDSFALFGDYPLLSIVIRSAKECGVYYSRREINHALNQSEELGANRKGIKTQLLDQLENITWRNEIDENL